MGMNAIAVYMLSELLAELIGEWHLAGGVSVKHWIFQTIFAPLASPSMAALLYALAYTALMYLFAYLLYRKKWFFRV
jgi:predicted acyltransferase